MNGNKRIMCIGQIVNGEIDWRISALPPADDTEAFNAACDERFDSAPMFSHFEHLIDDDRYDGSIEDDHDWIRRGC